MKRINTQFTLTKCSTYNNADISDQSEPLDHFRHRIDGDGRVLFRLLHVVRQTTVSEIRIAIQYQPGRVWTSAGFVHVLNVICISTFGFASWTLWPPLPPVLCWVLSPAPVSCRLGFGGHYLNYMCQTSHSSISRSYNLTRYCIRGLYNCRLFLYSHLCAKQQQTKVSVLQTDQDEHFLNSDMPWLYLRKLLGCQKDI
jgi:hypothetical protein